MIANWFFGLSLSQAIGVVFFGTILLGCLAVMATDAAVKAVVQFRLAGADEFADRDDPFAITSKPVYKSDDEFRRIDLQSFTCLHCCEQDRCSFAFDAYCTDGDCLNK